MYRKRIIRLALFTLVGKMISDVSGKNKNNKSSVNVPDFVGVVEVKHSIKGRIRYRIPKLKGDNTLAEYITGQLSKVKFINNVEANAITGSLLINYDYGQIDPNMLTAAIVKLLNLEVEINKKKDALVTRELSNMKEVLNLAIYNKTKGILDIKSIYLIIIMVFAIRGIRTAPKMIPNGYTMARWAYKEI